MDYYQEIIRNLVFRSIQTETRLSERQVAQLRWSQIDGDKITTPYKREVRISNETRHALETLRKRSGNKWVFMTTSLAPALPPMTRREARAERRSQRPHLKLIWS